MHRRTYAVLLVICLTLTMASGFAKAAPITKPDNLSKSILAFFTEMREMKAPVWLVPGLRLVYEITNEDYADPTKDKTGYLIYDVVDVKGSYVASTLSTSQKTGDKLTGLMFGSVLVEEPTIGRYWITPELFEEGRIPKEKYDIFYSTVLNISNEEYEAILMAFESATAERTVAFDKETGMLLLVDMVISDAAGTAIQGTKIVYVGTRLSFPPWYGENVTGLSTGTQLKYKAVFISADSAEEQTLEIKVVENNGTWALLDRTSVNSLGTRATSQVVSSSSSGDVYVLWLPTKLLLGFKEGDVLFEEDLTGSMVKAMEIREDPVYGQVRVMLFTDNAVHTECTFSLKTGYLISLHQKPLVEGIQEVRYNLTSVK